MSTDVQLVGDALLGATAVSTPLWVFNLEAALTGYVLIVGAILLTLRVVKVIYDLKKDRRDLAKEE